jgi:hypothetical protein
LIPSESSAVSKLGSSVLMLSAPSEQNSWANETNKTYFRGRQGWQWDRGLSSHSMIVLGIGYFSWLDLLECNVPLCVCTLQYNGEHRLHKSVCGLWHPH